MYKAKQNVIWIIVVIISGIFTGWAIYLALLLPIADASGWWQVGIAFAGLPIIFYGLADMEKQVREAQWKPEISIGLSGVGPISYIKTQKVLPKTVSINQGYPFFQLVVRNGGKLAAKFVKIHLEFASFQDDSYQRLATTPVESLAAPTVKIPEDNPFKWQNNKDFIFTGGDDWVIYPLDESVFGFFLKTVIVDQPPIPHDYHFHCTVWTEGLDNPASEDLIVRITRNQKEVHQGPFQVAD